MKSRTKFSLKEDETIINLTREGKDIDFIISQLPQRSRRQILSRLQHLGKIETKLQWSPHEDILLLDNFYKFGPKYQDYQNISTGRKRKEIRERLKILLDKSEEQMLNEEEMFVFNKIEFILRQNEDFVNYRKRKLSYNENFNQKHPLIPDIYSLISSRGKGSVKDHITMDKISDVFFTMLKETDEFKDKSNRFKKRIIKYNINVLFAHLAYHHKEILCSHISNITRLLPEKADKELFLRELNERIDEIHKVYDFNVSQNEKLINFESPILNISNNDELATSQSQSPSFPKIASQSPSFSENVSQLDSSQFDNDLFRLSRIPDNLNDEQSNEQISFVNDQCDFFDFNVNQNEEFIGLGSTIPNRSNNDELATSQSQSPSFPQNDSQSPSLPEIVSQPDLSQVDSVFSQSFRILDDQWDSLAQSQF